MVEMSGSFADRRNVGNGGDEAARLPAGPKCVILPTTTVSRRRLPYVLVATRMPHRMLPCAHFLCLDREVFDASLRRETRQSSVTCA